MRSFALFGIALGVGGAAAAFGCAPADNKEAGSSEAAATAADLTLAQDAQDVISGGHAHCNQCHSAGRDDVKRWTDAMFNVAFDCFNTPALSPVDRVACLSDDKTNPAATFSDAKLGLFAGGAAFLQSTFMTADPTGARFAAFQRIAMPLGNGPGGTHPVAMTAADFTKVVKWVFQGVPAFNDVFGGPPEPDACVQNITPALSQHVADMKTQGWGAQLANASTPMFGCAAGGSPTSCFADLPAITQPWGNTGVDQTLRHLRDLPRTSYWVRSSADGRFVGYGQFTAASVIDLAKPQGTPPITVDARYDPSFFPNNDGVSFAGTDLAATDPGPIRVCKQSVLVAAASLPTPNLTLKETGCSELLDSVYQSVGAALDGSVFWMSNGTHVNDDGGNQTQAPLEGFESDAVTQLTPMVSDGVGYVPKAEVDVTTPLEGDQILSPSSQILITRFGSKPGHQGYTLRKLTTATTGGNITATTEVVGKICGAGAKASMSFDERFVVTHRYAEQAADGGASVKNSNIILTDLKTGDVVQVTNMGPNQYALYPHFRADGWLYFLVRDLNATSDGGVVGETLVASDVGLKRH